MYQTDPYVLVLLPDKTMFVFDYAVGFNFVGLNQFEIQEIKDTELICLRVLQKECFKIITMQTSNKVFSTYLRMYSW